MPAGGREPPASPGPPGDEPEYPPGRRRTGRRLRVSGHALLLGHLRPLPVLRVDAAVGDGRGGEVLAEEAAAGAVGQGDALGGDLKGGKRGLTWHLCLQIIFMAKSLSSHAFPKMGEKERHQAPPGVLSISLHGI